MRYQSGKKPETSGQFTPKLRSPKSPVQQPAVQHEEPAQEHPVSVQPVEPADPRQIGSSKDDQREILNDNNSQGHAQPHPETVAGQHATGSFTDKKRPGG